MDLPDGVQQIVDEARFGLFCMGLSRLMASRTLLGALVERWWDTTNSFYFSTTGDMTMTPYDFAMLTGLEVGGQLIPYDVDMGEWEAAWTYLLGAHPLIFCSGTVRYTWFSDHFRGTEPATIEATEQYARGFLMFLFGTTLFADRANTVRLYLLSALVDLPQVRHYDWGSAGLTTLYCYMSSTSRKSGNRVGCYWRAWEYSDCHYLTFHSYGYTPISQRLLPSRRLRHLSRSNSFYISDRNSSAYARVVYRLRGSFGRGCQSGPYFIFPEPRALLGTGLCPRDSYAEPGSLASASCARHWACHYIVHAPARRTADLASSSKARAGEAPSMSRARVADVPSMSSARAADAPSTSRARTPRGEPREMPTTR
ncbi:hypothetical protein ACSBR2_030807 [Camellia fascicularis]